MRWLSWQKGRQWADYAKMMLLDTTYFDIYLIYYPPEAELPEHVDPVPGYKHYRLNVVLRKPRKGGVFKCANPIIGTDRVKLFRSDKPHALTLTKGIRVVLSFGVIIKESP